MKTERNFCFGDCRSGRILSCALETIVGADGFDDEGRPVSLPVKDLDYVVRHAQPDTVDASDGRRSSGSGSASSVSVLFWG